MVLTNIKNTQKESGFTIVELLVVIVVIGILAAITIVSYVGITAKANGTANKSNANSVLSSALSFYAESTSNVFPATAATPALTIPNFNTATSSSKLPAGINVSNVTPTSGTTTAISYRLAGTTGVCVGYWDSGAATPAVVYIFGGAATADNGTTCS